MIRSSYKKVEIIPNSITEFAVSVDSGQSITPEIIFILSSHAISLKEGKVLIK